MADLDVNRGWLVSPNAEVELMWLNVQIQERRSRIARYKQDIEDLQKGKILDLQAKIIMLEKEVAAMEQSKNGGVIDVATST